MIEIIRKEAGFDHASLKVLLRFIEIKSTRTLSYSTESEVADVVIDTMHTPSERIVKNVSKDYPSDLWYIVGTDDIKCYQSGYRVNVSVQESYIREL